MAKTGPCRYCGREWDQLLDQEHFIGQQFQDWFPEKHLGGVYGQRFLDGEYRPLPNAWSFPVGGIGHDCCNGGWMKDVDIEVEPILERSLRTDPIILSPPEQRVLTRWGAKLVSTAELARPARGRMATLDERNWIRSHRNPPPGTQAWLCAWEWDAGQPSISWTSLGLGVQGAEAPERPPHSPNTYAAAIAFAHFELILFSTRTNVRVATPNDRFADRVVSIYPPNGNVSWPILPLLTVEEMVTVGHTLRHTFAGMFAFG